jgi:hypothetical protein
MVYAVNRRGNNNNPEEGKTGTRFHENNQVKADQPKKQSPFHQILKEYRYNDGEITKWFVDSWDHFTTFAAACRFMGEQIEAKKYRAFCFNADWPAIIDRYLFLKRKLAGGPAGT